MKKFVQIAFLLIGGALGLVFLPPLYELLHLSSNPWLDNPYVSVALGALLLFTLSFAFSDYFVKLISWMEEVLFKVPVGDLLFGTLGLIIGLIVAYFLGFAINSVKVPFVTEVLPIILSFVLGYLGFRLGFRKRDELIQLFTLRSNHTKKKAAEGAEIPEVRGSYKLLDTSVIIDGRIADISETGFIEGVLVVPQFVLTELQHIADSSDTLKRTRGRRGLDILRKLQDERKTNVEITDEDFEDVQEVDLKLVRLAKKWVTILKLSQMILTLIKSVSYIM